MAEQELRAVRDALVAQGVEHGTDFAILGTGERTASVSEIIVLRGDLDGWHVDCRDMGVNRELLRTDDFERATARFVDEVHELAAARGRGPRATGPKRTRTVEQLREDRLRGEP